jgi:hypothetical protein
VLLPPARVLAPVRFVGPLGGGVPDESQHEGEDEITTSIARMVIDAPTAIIKQARRKRGIHVLMQWSDREIFEEEISPSRRGSNAVRKRVFEGSLATRAIRVHY